MNWGMAARYCDPPCTNWMIPLRNRQTSNWPSCKRQGDSEPCADGKLSHLLVIQTIRMLGPASANSAESENSRLPLPECGSDVQADLRGLPSFVHCRRPASTGQRPGSR